MKVILTQDSKAGKKNSVVEVSAGYATNFLFKKNLALPYNKNTEKQLQNILLEEEKLEQERRKEALILKEKLEKISLSFKLKASLRNDGSVSVHSSISSKNIFKELEEKYDLKMDRHSLEHVHINTLGNQTVIFNIYKDIKASMTIKVEKDE